MKVACALAVVMVACSPSGESPKPAPAPPPLVARADATVEATVFDNVADLVVGLEHACALRDGHVYCWGHTLGLGSDSRHAVERVELPSIRALSTGGRRVCAVGVTGELFCWGELVGESGPGIRGQVLSPGAPELQIKWGPPAKLDFGAPIAKVAVGMTHICALTDRRDLYCWGSANGRQLEVDTPMRAAELIAEGVDDVEVGHGWTCFVQRGKRTCRGKHPGMTGLAQQEHAQTAGWIMASCGVSPEREVVCMGALTLVYAGKPVPSEGTGERVKIDGVADVRALAMGSMHACALRGDGSVSCWGAEPPAQVALPGPAKKVGAGSHRSCALLERGDVVCWGTGAAKSADPITMASSPARSTPHTIVVETANQRYTLRDKPTPTEVAGTTWRVCLSQIGAARPKPHCDATSAYQLRFEAKQFTAEGKSTVWRGTWKRVKDDIVVTEQPAPAGTRWEWKLAIRGEEISGDRHIKGDAPMYLVLGRKHGP